MKDIKNLDIKINTEYYNQVIQEHRDRYKEDLEKGIMLNPTDSKIEEANYLMSENIAEFSKMDQILFEEFSETEEMVDEDTEKLNMDGYKECFIYVGIRDGADVPVIILEDNFKNYSKEEKDNFTFVSDFKFSAFVNEEDQTDIVVPNNINILEMFENEYDRYIKSHNRINELTDDEIEELNSNLGFQVVNTNNSDEYLNLLTKYVSLSRAPNFKNGLCRVIMKYHGEGERPELVQINKYKKSEVQYYGDHIYNCILNKYTNEVIMVEPSADPFADFERIMYRLEFSNNRKRKNPRKSLEDLRSRKDVSFDSFNINYQIESNIASDRKSHV